MSHIFRIGDRVRIKYSAIPTRVGMEATIIAIAKGVAHIQHGICDCYDLDIDGIGPLDESGGQIAYLGDDLSPILPKSLPAEIIAMTGLPDFQIAAGEYV